MSPEHEHIQRARRLIADLEAPRTPHTPTATLPTGNGSDTLAQLNEDQQAAVGRCKWLLPDGVVAALTAMHVHC